MTSFPTVTATVAALIGLLAVLLAARVIVFRVRFKVNAGDGGQALLAQAIRAHANLVEHAPLALIVLAFAEASVAWRWLILILGVLLLIAAWRALGASATRSAAAPGGRRAPA